MTKRTEDRIFKNQNLTVRHHRDRFGCDKCGVDCATECFIGYCGNVLWICRSCFKEITQKTETKSEGS